MLAVVFLSFLVLSAYAKFEAGTTTPKYIDTAKTGLAETVGNKGYLNCRFETLSDGTQVKLYWSINNLLSVVELALSIDFTILKGGGWFAVGVSSALAEQNAMINGDIVMGYIDRFGNGFGYVAALESVGKVTPTFANPPNVTASTIGVSQAIVGKDDLAIMEFQMPLSKWSGGGKALMLSYRAEDPNFDAEEPPVAGEAIKSGKHDGFKAVRNFDVNTASTSCPVPPAPTPAPPTPAPTVAGPCGQLASFAGEQLRIPLAGLDDVVVDYTVDCVAKQIEFTVTGQSAGWLAIGFNVGSTMVNTDTYEMWFDGDTAKIVNGFAVGRQNPTATQSEDVAVIGSSKNGDKLSFTFRRAFDTGNADKDTAFVFGNKLYVHAAANTASTDPATKHSVKAVGPLVELFTVSATAPTPVPTVAEPTPAPTVAGACGALSGEFVNSVAVPLAGSLVTVNALVDCAAEEVEFTVSGNSQGWLAFGFNDAPSMIGTDTYQVWLAADGTPKVRNGYVPGSAKTVVDNAVGTDITPVSGQRVGDLLSVTFRRKLDTGAADDRALVPGAPLYVLVARNDAASTPSAKHTDKAAADERFELFVDGGPIIGGPCVDADAFSNRVELQLDGSTVTIDVAVDCVNAVAEFTLAGASDGWLAFGLSDTPTMDGSDTYQVAFDFANGAATVRNGRANGYTLSEDEQFAAVRGSRVDGTLSVTFRRALYTGRATDRALFAGRPYYVHVAKNGAAGAAFAAKHGAKTKATARTELFVAGDVPALPDPCAASGATSFENSAQIEMDGGVVTLDWIVDCTAATIELTVSGESTGWLGVGFTDFADKMSGADTYQMRVTDDGGVEVRNGRAVGREVVEDGLIAGATGGFADGRITATFKRALDTNNGANDVVFSAGKRWFVNVARRNNVDADWTKKHDFRSWSDDSFEFFEAAAITAPTPAPAPTAALVQRGSVKATLGGDDVELAYVIDCEEEEIEFTLSGTSSGWLAVGFNEDEGKMNGADVYLTAIDDDGDGTVMNGKTDGYSVEEQDEDDADAAERDGDKLSVTWTRDFEGDEDDDADFEHGTPLFVIFARNDDDDNFENQHTDRTPATEAHEFFVDGACPEPTPAPTASANPCDNGETSFQNTYYAALGDELVTLDYDVDCDKEEIEFTLSGATAGWLAVGFNADDKMTGADTYQLRVVDGDAELRNSYADAKALPDDDDTEVTEVDGSLSSGSLEATFTRKWNTGAATDRELRAGAPLHVLVARSADTAWTTKHEVRAVSADAIDLFTDKAWPNPLAPTPTPTPTPTVSAAAPLAATAVAVLAAGVALLF